MMKHVVKLRNDLVFISHYVSMSVIMFIQEYDILDMHH